MSSFCAISNLQHAEASAAREPDEAPEHEQGVAVQEAEPELKKPPQYRVYLLNDDYTPMVFVVHVLEAFFGMTRELATRVMLNVHTHGRGVCGVFTRDIAESKVNQVNAFARAHQHPLLCDMEESA